MATQKTTILFARHEDHLNQVLLEEAVARAIERGENLKDELGFLIDAVVVSPLPRAVATATEMMKGHGEPDMKFTTEPRLGDFKTDSRAAGALDHLKQVAMERYGNTEDANLARAVLDMPEIHQLMTLRAKEGAEALLEIAKANQGKTILSVSHGVARMEIVINWLLGMRNSTELLHIANRLIERGEVVKLVFEPADDGEMKLAYFEPLELLGT